MESKVISHDVKIVLTHLAWLMLMMKKLEMADLMDYPGKGGKNSPLLPQLLDGLIVFILPYTRNSIYIAIY